MANSKNTLSNITFRNNNIELKPFTNMMLILTNNCNLRCSYCYEQGHGYDPSKNMSFETAKKSVDLFFNQIPNSVKRTSIHFFGGEPHIAFDLMKKIINYTYNHRTIGGYEGEKYNYVVNTNGVILNDEIFSLYSELGKKINIRVSVDGYKENHDITRKTIDGKGSWSIVEKNLYKYRILKEEYGVKVGLVNTINKANCKDIYYNFINLYELTGMNIGTLFVHEDNMTDNDFQMIKEQVGRLHDYCVKQNMRFSICNVKRKKNNNSGITICSAGTRSFTVDHRGNISPCHRCYFNDMGSMYNMGNLEAGISVPKRAFMHEINNINMLPEKCRKCNPIIRHKCHICFSTNKKVYDNPHSIPSKYCLFQKELYYMLLDKELMLSKIISHKEDIFK